MLRSFPRRYHTLPEPEKPFEALAEQAKQTRTQFFVYLATLAFLLVTVLSITDKQLLLNNSLVTLPLINVSVPPKYVLIFGPALLLITFCNLHIHWFRYLAEVKKLGVSSQAEQRHLFPLMLYQALYHRQEGFVGLLECILAMHALFGLLVQVQWCFVWQILKFYDFWASVAGLIVLGVAIGLNIYWVEKNPPDLFRWWERAISICLTVVVIACGYYLKTGELKPHLTVNYTVLSPPPELLDTPIVKPFLDKLNKEALAETETNQQQHNKDKTKILTPETHDVFDGVYWLDLRGRSLARANLEGRLRNKGMHAGVKNVFY